MDKFIFTLDTNEEWLQTNKIKWGLICRFFGEKDPDWESIPLTRDCAWIIERSEATNHAGALLINCLQKIRENHGFWSGFFPSLSMDQERNLNSSQFNRQASITIFDNFTKKVWRGSVYEANERTLEN